MKKETINILCATDANYVPYCGVMLTSVFESNKHTRVDAYILTDTPLPAKAQRQFAQLAEKYGNSINYLLIDKSFLEKFPIKGMSYWSIATYYRLYASELLPESVHRILYLDCDIIVRGDLSPLWQLDLTDKAAGGVSDIFEYWGEFQRRLHYPMEAGYFNAGVLLINVDYWRKHNIGQQCLEFLKNHYDWIEANDQDVLNAVLWDKKLRLPVTYNYQVQFLADYFYHKEEPELQAEIWNTKDNPIVIHYAVPTKPWNVLYYQMPYKKIWWQYKRLSPWWYILPSLPKRKTVNYLIKRYLLWPFGIMWKTGYTIAQSINKL